jgi:hypothetical protein
VEITAQKIRKGKILWWICKCFVMAKTLYFFSIN